MGDQFISEQTVAEENLFNQNILLEIRLNGSYSFGRLLELLHEEFGIDLSIKKGFVNYHEGANYGKVVFLVRDSWERVVLLARLLNEFYGIPAYLPEIRTAGKKEKE